MITIQMTMCPGLMPGAHEQLLLDAGLPFRRISPTVAELDLTPDQLDNLRNRYYQPNAISIIKEDAPVKATWSAAEVQAETDAAYARGFRDGKAEGLAEKEAVAAKK